MSQTFTCPSCGAPLDPEGDATTIRCKFCNESVVVPPELRTKSRPARTVRAVAQPDPTDFAVPIDLSEPKKRRSYWVPAVVILVAVFILISFMPDFVPLGSALSFITSAKTATVAPTARPVVHIQIAFTPTVVPELLLGDVLPAPLPGTRPSDFLVKVRDGDRSQTNRVALVDGKKHSIIWHTQGLSDSWSDAKMFAGQTQVYVADQTTLWTLDRQTGKTKWQATLDNGVATYCSTCLGQYLNTVVVLLKDGTLQAADAATGKLTWHKTLNNLNTNLFSVGGNPAVEDDMDGNKTAFYIFDAFSGKVVQQIDLGCTAKDNQDALGEIFPSQDGKSLYAFYDDCMQNVSLPDGKVLSQVLAPASGDAWSNAWFATYIVPGNGVIYYAEDEGGNATAVNQMDMTKGTAAVFLSDSKYQLYPTWVSGNILIVLAEPAYDSTADEFWGVDTQSGSRLWKYAIPGAGRLAYSEVRSTSQGVFEVGCRTEPNGCTWSALDPQTGIGTHSGQSSLGGDSLEGTWDQDTLYLVGDHNINVIDALTDQLLYQWP